MNELKKNEIVSAQVLLATAEPLHAAQLTAQEIHRVLPPTAVVEQVQADFAEAGFAVGEAVGLSFSITAPVGVFERIFKTKLSRTARGGIIISPGGAELLPLAKLRPLLAQNIEAVTFTPPPDYGPANFH